MSLTPRSHPQILPGAEPGPGAGRIRRARRRWGLVSLVTLLAGLVVTLAAVGAEQRGMADRDREAMEVATRDVTEAFRMELQRQNDFVADTAAFVATTPDITTAELEAWVQATRVFDRNPELSGVGFVRYLPRDAIAEHAARIGADPALAGFLSADGSLAVEPPSERDTVCLLQATADRTGSIGVIAPDYDICSDEELASTVRPIVATGESVYRSGTTVAGTVPLIVVTPVFEGAAFPTTVAGRRDAFIGSIATLVDADALVARVASRRDDVAVALRYRDPASDVSFGSGDVAEAAGPEWVVPLVLGWQLTVRLIDASGSVWTPTAVLLLVAGVSATVLFAAFLFVLGTGRARALDLVDAATEELRHASLHDPLTGLANRRFVSERADELFSRARRDGSVPAALFIDLDGFKAVNDTHGHAAGDEVLQEVARRLRQEVRGADVVGRLGGDEFVVLLDGAGSVDPPESVAARLLERVRDPITLPGGDVVTVSASIGIAVGLRDDGDVLVGEADIAAYRAKAAGRDRWMRAVDDPDVPVLL